MLSRLPDAELYSIHNSSIEAARDDGCVEIMKIHADIVCMHVRDEDDRAKEGVQHQSGGTIREVSKCEHAM